MTYTKEKRYLVSGFYDYGQVDVLISQSGKINLYSIEGADEYIVPSETSAFFVDKQAYEDYKSSQIPTNIEHVKQYLQYLYANEDDERLKEILPPRLYACYHKGYWNTIYFKYHEFDKIKKAISGLLEIGTHTIRPSQVDYITYLAGNKTELHLTSGKVITSDDETEKIIIKAMFGGNASGKYLDR